MLCVVALCFVRRVLFVWCLLLVVFGVRRVACIVLCRVWCLVVGLCGLCVVRWLWSGVCYALFVAYCLSFWCLSFVYLGLRCVVGFCVAY